MIMTTYDNSPENSTSLDDCPIIREHYGFAQEAAANAFGGRWIAPEDRDFRDRPPPGAPAAVKPKPPQRPDIVSALRVKRRAA